MSCGMPPPSVFNQDGAEPLLCVDCWLCFWRARVSSPWMHLFAYDVAHDPTNAYETSAFRWSLAPGLIPMPGPLSRAWPFYGQEALLEDIGLANGPSPNRISFLYMHHLKETLGCWFGKISWAELWRAKRLQQKKKHQVAWSESKQSKNTELKGCWILTTVHVKTKLQKQVTLPKGKRPQNNARSFARNREFSACVCFLYKRNFARRFLRRFQNQSEKDLFPFTFFF